MGADLLHDRMQADAHNDVKAWMAEDEDMLNVKLWMAGASKQWCKFDLFPDMFVQGLRVDRNIYKDTVWYPKGIGLVFYGAHATKDFPSTDWLLALLARCNEPELRDSMTCNGGERESCWGGWVGKRR